MSQFELVEDYLTNRLDDGARLAFEQQIATDSQLKAEVELQKGIIEGVKKARIAELKTMLNNVPIGGGASVIAGKIAIATISAGILGTALYFGLRSTPIEEMNSHQEETTIEQPTISQQEPEKIETIAETMEEVKPTPQKVENSSGVKKMTKPKVVSPRIEVMDLTEDMKVNTEESAVPKPANKQTISTSTVEVDTDNTSKVYTFHYQFKDDKLVLYGPFDSSLYEIIEINGGTHTVFLYYKGSYYHLDDRDVQIVPLIMIRDLELLDKLKKFRNNN